MSVATENGITSYTNGITSYTNGSTIGIIKEIKNPKVATITPAENGFVVATSKVTEYGQNFAVAYTIEEVNKIISEYYAA